MDLRVEHLAVSIARQSIIQDVSLNVMNHSFTALLGPNGSGKSTLLKAIYRILRPQNGTIFLDNQNLTEIPSKKIAQKMAVVSQFQQNSFDFTVEEVVLMGRSPHLKALEKLHPEDWQLVEDALEKTGLVGLRKRAVANLSGGEQQRVTMARAIVQNPSLMILDEPSNHLDIKYQLELLKLIRQLNLNALAALHDLSLAAQFCDYLYFLKDGFIRYEGKPNDIITKEVIKDIYEVDCEVSLDSKTNHLQISYY
ncbi:ABC transporter ATP-binding protein [Enterococcus camelliae]|uniref:ABC transporter ATP-binding protein n=1 Tax=Enterococcus camelliae TaxID=453959 RepID=A0ABW5TJI4_9ENTE